MSPRATQIGFSQRIHLEWLERTANLVLAGNDKTAINTLLQELLKDKVSVGGNAKSNNREKVINILMKIWFNVPRGLEELRDDSLELLRRLARDEHIAVHWGMAMAVYPFWAEVAAQTGRLLRLQGTSAAAHIQRRLREHYGERETVSRAARRVLRSFVDWGVLNKTAKKGIYSQGLSFSINDPKLIALLVEASLHARTNGSAAIRELLDNTCIFPFRLAHVSAENLAGTSARLDILRHGLDDDLVILRNQNKDEGGGQ